MFNRKSQTILSEHYTKLIDHEDAPSGESTEDFITIKRRDHTLEGESLPESSYLSKRKLKMGQSKKAMLSHHGNPTKLVFDEEGASHPIYELAGEDDFKNDGDAKEQQQTFVEAEREVLRVADLEDKERAKQKRRDKKRKMKGDIDEVKISVRFAFSIRSDSLRQPSHAELEPMDDDGYVSPVFDLSDRSDDDGISPYQPDKPQKKKQRRTEEAPVKAELDLEALALRAMGKR